MKINVFFIVLLCCAGFLAAAEDGLPYVQHKDLLYGQAHGVGLMMDVFVPTGDKNGLAILDIASGAWNSDRGKIRDHKMARMYDEFCARGYTVFAARPGSVSRFSSDDMLEHIRMAIRKIHEDAESYGIDPDKLGITGASAGGHLTLMTLVAGAPENESIAAAGIFFPPTNFLDYGGQDLDLRRFGGLFFPGGASGRSDEEIKAKAAKVSPGLLIDGKLPPILLFHGDADPLVPLQQSEFLVEQLKAAGSEVEFHIKAGGAHPWLTIGEEVAQMAAWFDSQLVGK